MENEKTKLGISIGLFGALLYFIGATGNGVFLLGFAFGYIMVFEKSEQLKKTAIKAFILAIFFAVLVMLISYSISIMTYLFGMISSFFARNISGSQLISYFFNSLSYFSNILSFIVRIIEIIVFVVFGFRAYKLKDIKIKWIDKIIDRENQIT